MDFSELPPAEYESVCCATRFGRPPQFDTRMVPRAHRGPLVGLLAVISVVISFPNQVHADDPSVVWTKAWAPAGPPGGPGRAAAVSPKGELFVQSGASLFDQSLARISSSGQILGQEKLEGASFLAQEFDADGNRYVTGLVFSNGLFNVSQVRGFFAAKYGSSNELLWVRSELPQPDQPPFTSLGTAIAIDPDRNVVVGGYARGPTALGTNIFDETPAPRPIFCKYDSSGNLLWARRIEFWPSGASDGGGQLDDLAVDSAGNIIICGGFYAGTADFGGTTLYPGTGGVSDYYERFIAKYLPDGTFQWGQVGWYGLSVVVDGQDNVLLGWARGLAKLNPNGDVLWSKDWRAGPSPGTKGLALHPSGGVLFTGEFNGTRQFDNVTLQARGTEWQDFFVALADAAGNIQWALSGGGLDLDGYSTVHCDPQGIIFVTGVTRSTDGRFGGLPLAAISNTDTVFAAKISPKPPLKIAYSPGNAKLSWPVGATNYVLETTTSFSAVSWTTVTNTPTITATNRSVQLPLTGNARFFRLRRP